MEIVWPPLLYDGPAKAPLAAGEALALHARAVRRPFLHVWRHRRALMLGPRDGRLPHAGIAARVLAEKGVHSAVRPFGGAAVPLDQGVVCLTWIIPGEIGLSAAFEALATWIVRACPREPGVPAPQMGEIQGAYCPGRFDLSIAGVKFAGLAQRRLAGVVSVSAFVNVEEPSQDREKLVQEFYALAAEGMIVTGRQVDALPWSPGRVASLERLCGRRFTVSSFLESLVDAGRQAGMRIVRHEAGDASIRVHLDEAEERIGRFQI